MHRLLTWKRSLRVLAGASLAGLWLSSAVRVPLRADETIDDPGLTAATPGVLLMRSGWMVQGKILRSGDVYHVEQPNGNMAVPASQVRMRADSLRDLHRKLRAKVQEQPSTEAHLALARWCLTNRLLSEAKREAHDALALDAACDDARDLLKKIDDPQDPVRKGPFAPVLAKATPRARGATRPESLSWEHLRRDEAREYTERIQPVLLRHCSSAGCHSADSETGFRLERVGRNTSRHATERNLNAVLEQIDFESPRASALVTVPDAEHGHRRGRPPFVGTRGKEQLADLRRWVQLVTRNESLRKRQIAAESTRPDTVTHAAATDDRPEAARSAAKDPFDPAAFNRGR